MPKQLLVLKEDEKGTAASRRSVAKNKKLFQWKSRGFLNFFVEQRGGLGREYLENKQRKQAIFLYYDDSRKKYPAETEVSPSVIEFVIGNTLESGKWKT